MMRQFRFGMKHFFAVVTLLIALFILPMLVGINDGGYRTVVQYPSGDMEVKFESGLYYQGFGKETVYKDIISLDYGKTPDNSDGSVALNGINVRYQDGGTGTVYGITQFRLPIDEKSMLMLHKEYRSNSGVAHKLLKTLTEEVMNNTAGLMSSEQSYAEMRGTYAEWARDQLERGKYATLQKKVTEAEAGYGYCLNDELTAEQKKTCSTVKLVTKFIPVINVENGVPVYLDSDLKNYGISVAGFRMVDWGYEPKTLEQIARKREATMAIITAKAEAEKAKQDAITTEQQGIANVMRARYEKEVEKERSVVDAQRVKEVAIIEAEKLVEVATQQKLEAEQKKFAAKEYKQEMVLRGEGDAAYKRLVMEADGALQQKLDTYQAVMNRMAQAIERQKWVPEVQMGGTGSDNGNNAALNLIDMMNIKVAKDLALDMSMGGAK